MANPKDNYNEPEKVEVYKPCHANKLYIERISEDTRDNIIAEFAFCAGKHNINSTIKKELEYSEKHKCRNCRKEAMQFERYIKIDSAKTKLSREFIKKFIYYKIDKQNYWYIITAADKEYLNRPEVTLEYLSRPEVKKHEPIELKNEETL